MAAHNYDTNTLAMIEALNRNIGEVVWYEYLRDEYRALGGRVERCAQTLERVADRWPACVGWEMVSQGRRLATKVRIVRPIEIK